ncbi:MAG: CHAT domain-containing protein [Humidesulfovibrio sp.]|uniref:CHAT domain-containing protein n=1 Tax=Humidesulfovibrio sp. TaxID=2910988 RepID=UPI0027F2B6BF|nr:CHAT domain-containing protein [Humidesulfovibrio sp.]MDQ7834058.1 CHAT domain-containing protein [Humidesulfovibrio sp.]
MNARPFRQLYRQILAGSCLALALLPWPATAATPKATPAAVPQTQLDQSAKALSEEALRATGKRLAPRRVEVNRPVQVTFETGAVQHLDITPDGKWLAYTRQSNGYSELWVRGLGDGLTGLPRRLAPALADRLSPALSPDGRRIAFVGMEDDVKGDIYLLDLANPQAQAQKLTGRATEDRSPCFRPDGKSLYFQQRDEGEPKRRIVALELANLSSAPRALDTDGDAAQPTLSPDGRRLAFVSARTGVSAVYVMNLASGAAAGLPQKLTTDVLPQAYPRFTPDGMTVLFTTAPVFGVTSDQGGIQTVIARAPVPADAGQSSKPEDLTSAQGADLSPVMAAGRLFFLASRALGNTIPSNVFSLPPEGEIPDKSSAELMTLAETLASQLPVDRHLTILALGKAARTSGYRGDIAAKALLGMGRQYESLGLETPARQAFDAASALDVQPESGFAHIRSLLLGVAEDTRQALNDKGRRAALQAGLKALSGIAAKPADTPAQSRVQAQARLEQARLLQSAGDSKSMAEAIRLLDAQLAVRGIAPEQAAEALFLKAETFGRIGQVQAVLPIHAQVIRDYPDNGPWADMAVSRVLDRTVEAAGPKPEAQAQALLLLSGQHRLDLPKLSLGALNRLGDVYYASDEWSKAKDAYRQALDNANAWQKQSPQNASQVATQVAAARLALAEILYREERFHQALDLYESEMASRPFEDRLYRLAKTAHLRKSTAAGDYLLRIGEVPSARAIFAGLLRDDPDFVPAHRGMIRAAAALKTIPATLAEYRQKLSAKPDDATLLYATGLTLTYENGKAPLLEARDLISRAIQKNGQVEYFHQTLGYIDEVLETVHGERGRLEAALESYQRARFLNSREQNPENAANLDMNIGNIHFLLGQYAQAFEEYGKRQDSKVPFDNPETEILFYQRFGTSAFQARERDKPSLAFAKSLELVEQRIQPKYASEVFGRINKFVFDRVLTLALGHADLAEKAKTLATRQSELNNRLFEASIKPAGPPPDPAFGVYVKAVQELLSEQERIIGELPPLMQKDREASMQTLFVMAGKVREALGFPPRFVQLRAELYDRLGLAHQEAGRWHEAREAFEKALVMNTSLGLNQNLTANQRSVAYCAYMEAGLTTGLDRDKLLATAEAGFRRIPELVSKYGVADKKGGRAGKGLINIDLDVSLDKSTASQAAYGFSAEQELRLAETFLARIATERGRPREALGLVERQSTAFEKGSVAPQDTFGAALLLHRAGMLEASLGSEPQAFERFRRSAELSLEMKNPVSASLNVIDMAATLLRMPFDSKEFALRLNELRRVEALVAEGLRHKLPGGDSLSAPAFQNIMAAQNMALAERLPVTDALSAARRMELLARSGQRLAEGLSWFKNSLPAGNRRALALNAALHLNQAELALRLGEDDVRAEQLNAALVLADEGLLPGLRWRALAGLGRLKEALGVVQALPLDEASCGAGEITGAFAPLVAALVDAGKAEDAYNLTERLSELERVGRMGRLGVAQPTQAESQLLRRTALRLLAIRDLKARITATKGDDRVDLSRRLSQEEEILQRDLGLDRESLPGVARLGNSVAEQDWLTILHGLSLEASAAADSAASGSAEQRSRHAQLMTRLGALKAEAGKSIGRLDAPGALGLYLAAPSEAIDLMENLPKNTSTLRVVALPSPRRDAMRWVGLRLDADSVRSVALGSGPRPTLPAVAPGEQRLLAFEDPGFIASDDLRTAQAGALSGTHLVRSFKARKPFRKNLVFITGSAQAASIGFKGFDTKSVASSAAGLRQSLAQAHTVVAETPARLSQSAPSRQDELPVRFLALTPAKGEPLPLTGLATAMQDVSLAVLTQVPAESLPLVVHLLSLYGVPSVLAAQEADASGKGFTTSFLTAYAEDSAANARAKAHASGKDTASWLLLGDPGLNVAQAGAFAATQFARYVRSGMEDFKSGRHAQALSLFENALRVARSSTQFSKHLPDLLSYCRESAYASDQFDKSLAYAKELAALVAKSSPDTPAHAEALLRLGLVYARLEQYSQAITAVQQSTDMLANLELAPKEIEALASLGAVLENAIQYDNALKRFEGAAKLSKKTGSKELVAKQYLSIGRIHDLRLSQYAQAREAYGEALSIYTSLGRKADMAQAMLDIGRCARLIGNFTEAETRYAEALKLIAADKAQERLRARILIEQANNAWQQARFQQAFDLQRQVLKSAEKNGWVLEQVIARNTAGLLWWSLGDHNRAVRELDAALPLAQSLRIRKDEVATTLNNRGLVERDMGRYPLALKTLGEALAIDREIRSRWAIAYDLRNIAQTYVRMGDPRKALPLLDEALAIVSATGNRINQTKILLAQGEALLALGNDDKAKAAFTQADGLSREMGLRDSQWRALHGLARLDIAAGKRQEAKDLLQKAVDVIEGMRAELKVDQLKDGFIADKAVVYEDLVTLLADMGEVAESFRTAERSRARNLIDLLGNKRRSPQHKEDQALYERINAVRSALREQESLLAQAQGKNEREVYAKGVKRLQDDYRDILLELQANRPDIASLVSVNPLTLADVQRMLEPGVALLTYYVTANEILCWTVDRDRVELTRTRLGRDTLGQMILTYRRMLQNLEPVEAHSKELHALLLAPVLPKLNGVKVLGIIPHDSLHTLAFATLSDGDSNLLDRYPLFQLPSASVFKFTLERRKAERNTKVLAVGNPDLHDQSLELPFAEREVGSLAWNYPNMTALTREKATKSWISEHISDFGIIHLATHGEFDPVNPLFSALKLVSDKKDKDGDLDAAEIFDLKISADLIVLSACQTGLGKVTSGDEVQGLNQAFLYAGTHALVSSLWRVSDISTAMLMKQFYREYQSRPKAESLRRAMLHVKNRFPHPGYWGAFTLSGDYK